MNNLTEVLKSAISQAQAAQQEIFTDLVRLEYQAGHVTDDLGTKTLVWSQLYEGPGLVQTANRLRPEQTQAAAEPITVHTHVGKIPHDIVLDEASIYRLVVVDSFDSGNLGEYHVIFGETQAWATARRLQLKRA